MVRIELVGLLVLGLLAVPAWAGEGAHDPGARTQGELYTAKALELPPMEETYPISPAEAVAKFTVFQGVEDVERQGATLRFRVTADRATLGWGNFDGEEPFTERTHLWPMFFQVRFACRQLQDTETTLTLRFRNDGQVQRTPGPVQHELTGIEWNDLAFQRSVWTPNQATSPDAFGLTIRGAQGRTFELRDLAFVRPKRQGYFRKEVSLPDKEVWRAPATIGNMSLVHVNGQPLPDPSPVFPRPVDVGAMRYRTKKMDLADYLRPGENCVGVWGWRVGAHPPHLYLQCRVIFVDGTSMRLDTDATWRWSRTAADGWDEAGFDDTDWQQVRDEDEEVQEGDAVAKSHWYFHFKGDTDRPADESRMRLDNPRDQRLFFLDTRPVVARVRVPAGLAKRDPAVSWELLRYEYPDTLTSVTDAGARGDGVQHEYQEAGDDLVYLLDLGRLPRGIYTAQTRLVLDGDTVETRIREPLVVYGRLPMNSAPATSYESGMDLVEERVIDYTEPDTYEWMEVDASTVPPRHSDYEDAERAPVTEARIVERNGLTYRETRAHSGAQFSVKLTFDHPGDWYLMKLEYPDDRERWMGVSCTSRWRGKTSYARLGPAVITGFKFPVSGRMRELKWLYRPDPGPHAVNVISSQRDNTAAAARLRVYHIENGLPEMEGYQSGARRIGILTENDNPVNGFGNVFGVMREDKSAVDSRTSASLNQDPVIPACRELSWNLGTSEAYAQYLRWTGENASVMGVWQYSDGNRAYAPDWGMDMSRLSTDLRDTAARVLSANSVAPIPSIEFCYQFELMRRKGMYNDGQVALGADTGMLVDGRGRQIKSSLGQLNFMHPDVAEVLHAIAADVARKWQDVPDFSGINYTAFLTPNFSIPTLSGYSSRGSLTYLASSYDDVSIRRFQGDTGVSVPGAAEDPGRFRKRYEFLTAPDMREQWVSWRCEKMRAFFRDARRRVREVRPDLDIFASLYVDVRHAREWKETGLPLRDFLRLAGWDPTLYRDEEGLWCTHWLHGASTRYYRARRQTGYAPAWDMMSDPDYFALYAREDQRSQMVMHHWQEMERATFAMPEREGWAYPYQSTLQAHAAGPYAREPFTCGLIGGDPQFVMWAFSHVVRMVGHEQPMREYTRVLRALPAHKLAPVADTGFDTNLALRAWQDGATTYLLVANPGYWTVEGSISLTGVEALADLVTSDPAPTQEEGARTVLPVRLAPFGVAAYRVTGADAQIAQWQASPADEEELAYLQGLSSRVTRLMAMEEVRTTLPAQDRAYMDRMLEEIRTALADGQHARAWYAIHTPRFWTLWHDFLEKAAREMSFLPEELNTSRREATGEAPVIRARPAPEAVTVDGRLDEAAWDQGALRTGFVDQEGMPAVTETGVQVTYDDEHLYVGFACADKNVQELKATAAREDQLWSSQDDVAVILVQPDATRPEYYQLAFNAQGVRFDQRNVAGDHDTVWALDWHTAVQPDAGRALWTAEAAIPFHGLGLGGPGETQWRANFHRVFRNGKVGPFSWSPGGQSWHDTGAFGRLVFE